MERKKPGPKPENPLSVQVSFRTDVETKEILDTYCTRTQEKPSAVLRGLIHTLERQK